MDGYTVRCELAGTEESGSLPPAACRDQWFLELLTAKDLISAITEMLGVKPPDPSIPRITLGIGLGGLGVFSAQSVIYCQKKLVIVSTPRNSYSQ